MRDLFVLFDIDGTLVRKAGPHAAALVAGIRAATGLRASTEGIPTAGMLDVDILTLMLQAAGVSRKRIPALLPGVRRAAEFHYRRQCGDLRDRVIPGVAGLLQELMRRRIRAGLVTGNLRRIGWRKVERAGLRESFVLGAFSGEGNTRAALALKAIAEARRKGHAGRNTRLVLIGDTPNDIEAARIAGIPCVATATGVYPAAELEPHRPALLVSGLQEVNAERLAGL